MKYHCISIGVHIYFSTNLSKVEKFRDKYSPKAYIFTSDYPRTYGFAHRI
jgi:hypothetical protein